MELLYVPDSLINLSIDALGEYLSALLVASRHLDVINPITETLKQLEISIQERIPPPLAENLTDRLMACFYSVWSDRLPDDVRSQALRTVFHPSIESIKCFKDDPHPTAAISYCGPILSSDWNYVPLYKLKNLRILRIDFDVSDWTITDGQVLENLQKFSFKGNDDLLEDLSQVCPQLKSLDVTDCDMAVTNYTINSVLGFNFLEDLNLDCMYISSDVLMQILSSLSEEPERLKSFGCCRPSATIINFLADKFRSLSSLSLSWIKDGSLTPLKELNRLNKLSLKFMPFVVTKDLLKAIGSQLHCLELNQVYEVDLRIVCECCPSLYCLHFKYTVNQRRGFPIGLSLLPYDEAFPLPHFECVSCLSLKVNVPGFTKYVASRFVNLKRLYVLDGGTDFLLDDIIQRRGFKCLEHFFWKSIGKIIEVSLLDHQAMIWTHDFEKGERFIQTTKVVQLST